MEGGTAPRAVSKIMGQDALPGKSGRRGRGLRRVRAGRGGLGPAPKGGPPPLRGMRAAPPLARPEGCQGALYRKGGDNYVRMSSKAICNHLDLEF
ncbi:hypothetical protein LM599_05035 [Candidatus Acetothermia bacterium]|nr:hypothetical protein [Candidatus Acetothermia bacterium]